MAGQQVFLAAVTVAELRYGALVAGWGETRRERLERSIDSSSVVPVSDTLITTAAELRHSCRVIGHPLHEPIHANDLWGAATAVHIAASLLTADAVFQILDHADELVGRFEDYEPTDGDERSVEEYLLGRATLDRARSERQVVEAVTAARGKGLSWQRIGAVLGTSAQAAQLMAATTLGWPRAKQWSTLRSVLASLSMSGTTTVRRPPGLTSTEATARCSPPKTPDCTCGFGTDGTRRLQLRPPSGATHVDDAP